LNTTFIQGVPATGNIGFLSQSGAICGGVVDYIAKKEIGFSHFASLGNELDVDETDLIQFFGGHPKVNVIAAYIEEIQNGEKFLKIASQVSLEKPIVLLNAGQTDAGARAVSSHTGSMAGSYAAYQAAFRQAGVIEVNSLSALFDVAWALSCQPLPTHNQVAIFTNAGGPSALASDALAANGFELATITPEKQSILAGKLNPSAQVENPVDMLGGATPEEFSHCLSTLLDEPGIDVFLPILVPQSLVDPAEVARAIVKNANNTDKTVLACMVGDQSLAEARHVLHRNKVPMAVFPETPGQVLGSMRWYRDWSKNDPQPVMDFKDINIANVKKQLSSVEGKALGEAETRPIFDAYGMDVIPGDIATDPNEVVDIADKIGYPVVIKIVSPQILHKSDMGGIALNLATAKEVKDAVEEMRTKIRQAAPEAEIKGFLVEKMAPKGMEVIVGLRRDPNFGPLIMFGMGGVTVELYKDVGFGIAPLSADQAKGIIQQTKAGQLLQGYRGGPVFDVEAVLDAIGRLSQLALDFPEIAEVEINPLLVLPTGQGAKVLDARMILA
jgi:acetyltransferase